LTLYRILSYIGLSLKNADSQER